MSKSSPTILIVDDVPLNLLMLRAYLEAEDYNIIEASDGREAFEKAKEHKPALILLDIMMPGMDGMEACRKLKANPETLEIPIIFLSALTDENSRVMGLKIGGADFISKPFDENELLARVKIHLTLSQQKIQLEKYANQLEKMVEIKTKQLVHAERLATLGTFAAGIAHEINNPNTFIASNVQVLQLFWKTAAPILKGHSDEDKTGKLEKLLDDIEEIFEDILEGSRRISSIINSLKTYARHGGIKKEICRLSEIIEESLKLLRHRFKRGISVKREIPSDLKIHCDRQKMSQVFVNLLNNSVDAIKDKKGEIFISASVLGDELEIKIQDSGSGIDENIKEKIFDPFFTTKDKAKGTGLGLSIVRGIIEEHGGKILLKPSANGALFCIFLPFAKAFGEI